MNSKSSTDSRQVWIDLTDLSNWKGHMTGIQRVVYNLAEIYDQKGTARFFVHKVGEGFFEVTFAEVVNRSKMIEEVLSESPSSRLASIRELAEYNKNFIKRGIKFSYRRLPSRVRPLLRDQYHRIRKTQRRSQRIAGNKPITYPFKEGDVVMVLGASWYEHSMMRDMGRVKQKVSVRLINLVYDMIPQLYPHFFGQGFGDVYTKHMFNVFSLSDHLMAISSNTKKDAESFQDELLLPKVPIDVIRLGDNPSHQLAKESPHKRIQPGQYILSVGTIEVRKNYALLYNVWKKAANDGKRLPLLVIVGRPGWLAGDLMYMINFDPTMRDNILVLNDIDDDQLAWLYQNCLFSVYPSFYEGWGLPIAETLNYGKLCIAANISSMTEVAGDMIEYFDPYDSAGCLEKVRKYVDDQTALKKREEDIAAHYRPQTWLKSYAVCEKIVSTER